MNYRTNLILAPRYQDDKLLTKNASTEDIIKAVLHADPLAPKYTEAFAKTLRGKSVEATALNIWQFLKSKISYKIDPVGYQYVQSPGRLWYNRGLKKINSGDCKSYSVFTASILRNLGIEYGYRFAAYPDKYGNPGTIPTHVYVFIPLAGGKEIIIDAVWDGPFNTQKKFSFKQDNIMGEVHYLGSVDGARRNIKRAIEQQRNRQQQLRLQRNSSALFFLPGYNNTGGPVNIPRPSNTASATMPAIMEAASTVKLLPHPTDFNTPMERIGTTAEDAAIDLEILRQRLEIEKQNSMAISGGSNFQTGHYQDAINVVQGAIGNIDDPDYIEHLGNVLIAKAKKAGKKTGAGKFFQKIGKGLKKVGKGIVKVVTAPVRLLLKGAMEIYLPKAAIFFLYLFVDDKIKLPDMMLRKRKKAEKFKKFVVSGLGMKEKHFMGIIRNALTKKLGMAPEKYIANALGNRVSGIAGGDKKKGKKAHPNNRQRVRYTSSRQGVDTSSRQQVLTSLRKSMVPLDLQAKMNVADKGNPRPVRNKGKGLMDALKSGKDVFDAAKKGDLIGAAIAAIQWLISKLSGKGKAEKIEASDFPDIEADAANSFEFNDLHADYSDLDSSQKNRVKEVATDLIENNVPDGAVKNLIRQKLPFLRTEQSEEIEYEVKEGAEALDTTDARDLAKSIKEEGLQLDNAEKNGGGAATTGLCSCGN